MSYAIANNITSPLGLTTDANVQAVERGLTGLRRVGAPYGLPFAAVASLFTDEQRAALMLPGLTWFESLAVGSARRAIACAAEKDGSFAVDSARTLLVLATTKANVDLLSADLDVDPTPATAARHIATSLGVTTMPLVVCNACVSGLSALIVVQRLLAQHRYDHAIVVGADVQSAFIMSGFHSLMSLSERPCRPFDIERNGLNLGEAAATLVLSSSCPDGGEWWRLQDGRQTNDAYHVSTPHPKGEGLARALAPLAVQVDVDELAMVGLHGTATLYNDRMEAAAVKQAGLLTAPVSGLKGYFGHTMGAAGVLETVLCMAALDLGFVPGTRGYAERGVSAPLNICASHRPTERRTFIKTLSGFGGVNAALLCRKTRTTEVETEAVPASPVLVKNARLSPGDGALDLLYRQRSLTYPRFHKMDVLSQLGFLTSEQLLADGTRPDAIVLCGAHSSTLTDLRFLATLSADGQYFPSPALFVATLPNVAAGEMALRHHLTGETVMYQLPERNADLERQLQMAVLADPSVKNLLYGWLDYVDGQHYEADMALLEQANKNTNIM